MKRWADKPNAWPTGVRVMRWRFGLFGWLFGWKEHGIVGEYVYRSASTYVPIRWESGEEEWVHVSQIPGAL